MRYCIDTNFFIDMHRLHLPLESNPQFWDWLLGLAAQGIISMHEEVFDELTGYNDSLAPWVKKHKKVLVNGDFGDLYIRQVQEEGYQSRDESFLFTLKADPWVIASAMAMSAAVVTAEKPGKHLVPRKKKIASVCQVLNVPYLTVTAFLWEMRASMPA